MIAQRTSAPIVGYRCWVAHRGRLRSATAEDYWPAGVLEARCGDGQPHLAPEATCRCGIHVCYSHETALRYHVGELRRDRRGRSGLQYRAPYARIVALARSPHAERAGRALGVPVVDPAYLEAFAREVGGIQLRSSPADHTVAAEGRPPTPAPPAQGRLGPACWLVLTSLARVTWWLLKWSLRIAWWLTRRIVWTTVLVLVAVVGHALEQPQRRNR